MDYYLGYFISIILAIFSIIKNYIRSVILVWSMKGPPALPILGNALLLKDNDALLQYGDHAHTLYGSFFRIWIALLPTVFIYEPKHLKIIMSTTKNNQKSLFYKALHNFLGQGLITNNGNKWKHNRKLIQPFFHINILEKFVDLFTECSNRFITKLNGERTVKITSFINECVLDILHNGVLGVPFDKDSPYRQGELQAIKRYIKPWLLFESIFNHTSSAHYEKRQKDNLYSYTKKILINRKKELKDKKITKTCFLDMFIEIAENNGQFTDEDVIQEIITFMLAGQDSVGATMAFSMYYIAKYPEIQEKIHKEIFAFDVNGKITTAELNEMKYLEQVIKETLRMAPAVPILSRVLTEDVTLDDKVFPVGTNLLISPFITQRLAHVYPSPQKFDPDRFEESNVEKMHPYAFLPFSLGPRNCIGYKFALIELKTMLFYILRKYQLTLPPGKDKLIFSYRATLRATGGVWITLTPR